MGWEEEVEDGNGKPCPACPQFPNQCFNYKVLDSPTRNFKVRGNRHCSNGYCCDEKSGVYGRLSDWKGSGWYRVSGQAGSQLHTRGASVTGVCGTHCGGWLSGSHPSPMEGEVSRTVYFSDGSNDKQYSTSIKVVNCNNEY